MPNAEPVSAEHAFGADGEVVAVRGDEFEEELEVIVFDVGVDEDFAGAIHKADVHLVGMEIDSAVEFRGGGIILHTCYESGAARYRVNVDRGEVPEHFSALRHR